ncbi:MAG: uracil-DNA glycosylase, partial [Puniceicoccales bacterium]|nr:uracil-DNA glycosylase [Puniceicoccales bacterium]
MLELLGKSLAEMKREGLSRLSVDASALESLRIAVGHGVSAPLVAESSAPLSPPRAVEPLPVAAPLPEPYVAPAPVAAVPAAAPPEQTLPPPPVIEVPPGDKATRLAWLRERVLTCPVCNAHKRPGKQLVFGVGNPDAAIFFCGEAPGADEETKGEPFVGPAGELLTKIIGAMGLSREQVYIGNIMKWRPELPTLHGNRPPTPEEMAYCLPFLRAQLEIVRPSIIVALGGTAIDGLLGADPARTIGKIHGHWREFNGVPVMPTYHPSYLLRSNSKRSKRIVWEDMLLVMERL